MRIYRDADTLYVSLPMSDFLAMVEPVGEPNGHPKVARKRKRDWSAIIQKRNATLARKRAAAAS